MPVGEGGRPRSAVFFFVEAVATYVEPQVAGEGEEALHGLPVEFGGMLSGV
ncbi:MAG TPA: hypothetical protein VI365_17295 [Trebonia sp.]